MIERTYTARLYAPLFYSSSEGRVIRTQPTLSAIALSYALGYRYFNLEKRYVELGDMATTPTYDDLLDLPFFVSDMRPVSVRADERTFRSVDYRNERHFTTTDESVGKRVTGKPTVPPLIKQSGAGWQTMRHFLGIKPGSTYEFTLWFADDEQGRAAAERLPDRPFFRMGIKQTGEFRARRTEQEQDQDSLVSLNAFLLSEVYDLPTDLLTTLIDESIEYKRGNHYTLKHVIAPAAFARDRIVPKVIPNLERS